MKEILLKWFVCYWKIVFQAAFTSSSDDMNIFSILTRLRFLYSKTAKIVLEHVGENLENYIQMRESSKNTTKFSNAFTCTYFWNCSLVVNFMCKTKLYILKKWPTIWSPLANWKTSMKERYNNKICRETTMQNFILSTSARSTMLSILIFTKSNFKRLQKWRRSKLSSHFHWTR